MKCQFCNLEGECVHSQLFVRIEREGRHELTSLSKRPSEKHS